MFARVNRKRLILALITLTVLALAVGGGGLLLHHVLQGIPLQPPSQQQKKLQPYLAGQTLNVPRLSGVWVKDYPRAKVVVLRGRQVGKKQVIDLCAQRTLSRHHPMQIFPVAVDFVGRFFEDGAGNWRNPVGLSRHMARGMPRLVVSGSATNDWKKDALQLAASGGGKAWQLVTDRASPAATSDKATMNRQAWLLWHADGRKLLGETRRFNRAIRIARRSSGSCYGGREPAGKLEFTLFRADASSWQAMALAKVSVFPAQGGVLLAQIKPGKHAFPVAAIPSVEDKALFDAALEHGLVKRLPSGQLALAPSDLTDAWSAGMPVGVWEDVKKSGEVRRILKRIYTKASGLAVRTELKRFNNALLWAALRVRAKGGNDLVARNDQHTCQATVDGVDTMLSSGMPGLTARLFSEVPVGWSDWLSIADWPAKANANSRARFRLPATYSGRIELLTLGKITQIKGAHMISRRDVCTGPSCPATDLLQKSVIDITKPGQVEIEIQPDVRFAALNPTMAGYRKLSFENGRLEWQTPPYQSRPTKQRQPEITMAARNGKLLFASGKPSEAAGEMGLVPLVGSSALHGRSLVGMLNRLQKNDERAHTALISIDPALQRLSQSVLDCVAQQGRYWNAELGKCDRAGLASQSDGRRSSLVILDAASGDILASASAPGLPLDGVTQRELMDFDGFNRARSPLALRGWQHDGGVEHVAGSSFKLVTALGLEKAARKSLRINALLYGRSASYIDSEAKKHGYSFRMGSRCYPLPCSDRHADGSVPILNHHIQHNQQTGRFGLSQALGFSSNTWFAWLAEMTDSTLAGQASGGSPGVRALGGDALDRYRPVSAAAHRLGFGRAMRLDGGLLPSAFPWRAGDALQATPSQFEFAHDRHQIRKQAIGSRMQVTPLQMAVVAASIGQGRVVTPRLMLELNGKRAQPAAQQTLGIRVDRIRSGMKAVVEWGSARTAFSSLNAVRKGVFAKTGTANNLAAGGNVLWFVGYLEPNTIPGESRRLAFAVNISRSSLTAGEHAAPVMAAMFETMQKHAALKRAN